MTCVWKNNPTGPCHLSRWVLNGDWSEGSKKKNYTGWGVGEGGRGTEKKKTRKAY